MKYRISILALTMAANAGLCAYAADDRPNQRYNMQDVTDSHVPSAPNLHALGSVMADIDNDNDLDVIVAVEHGKNRIYLNDGNGKLTYARELLRTEAHDNEHVVANDFNQDGFVDLIFVAEDDRHHSFFLGSKSGQFTEVTERLPAMSEGNALDVGDVNGDDLPDIVVGNTAEKREGRDKANPQNFLWLNNPDNPGYFLDASASLPQLDNQTQDISLADIDGDGDLDMMVANQAPPNQLLLNDGKGKFTLSENRLDIQTALQTRQAHVADFTGDGNLDILLFNLTSNNHDWQKDPQTRLLINNGEGAFKDETHARIPFNTYSVYSGIPVDLNQDGAMDFIAGPIQIPGFVPLQVRAYINDGQGHFSDHTHEYIPEQTKGLSWGISKGDLNNDGIADVFIGGWGTQARLLLSHSSN